MNQQHFVQLDVHLDEFSTRCRFGGVTGSVILISGKEVLRGWESTGLRKRLYLGVEVVIDIIVATLVVV